MVPDAWLSGGLAGAVVLVAFIYILSALETAVINSRRSRMAQLFPAEKLVAAEQIIESPEQFQTSAHLAKSLAESLAYAVASLVGLELALLARADAFPTRLHDLLVLAWPGILLGAVAAYFAVTVVGEALAKALALRNPERLLVRSSGFIRGFTLLFTPVLWITRRLGRFAALSAGADPALTSRAAHSEEEIRLLVEGSAEEGVLEKEEKEMIHSIFDFTETVARQVMVPRIDVDSVSVEQTVDEVVRQALQTGHSRLPVHEGTLDNVVGVVHVKDLLPCLVDGDRHGSIRAAMREPYFVPEGKKIDELLQEFRTHKSQLAIVVDEFGGTSGLVTVEDVLEEIVGEIEDEYDVEQHPAAEISTTGEGTIVDARMTIGDVNEQLELGLPEGDYDTLGGFVFSLFGRPPTVGEQISHDNHDFVVEAMDGMRLIKIRVLTNEAPEASTDSAHA